MNFTQRRIRLDRAPAQVAVTVDHIPVLVIHPPGFRTHPARIAILKQTGIREDDRIRLVSPQSIDNFGKVIHMPGTPGSVEPKLHQVPVMRRQLL